VLVLIQYEIDSAKREGFLAHAREMREHAREVLGLDYDVHEDREHANRFTEVFACATVADYEALDERQDDRFRDLVARLESFTDLSRVRYCALSPLP
jgi:quinol monooxygenase YgiN